MSPSLDAHVHLWNRATDPQPWINPETMTAIDRDFAPDDLEQMLNVTSMDAAIVIQSSNSAAETRRLLTHGNPRIAGVVGWIDLTADADTQLDELDPAAYRRLVGIRHLVHSDPDSTWLTRPDVGAAFEQLAARDLGFDLVIRSWQLPIATAVVGDHPDVHFVVDHLGGVAESDDYVGWEAYLRQLAGRPNVSAKISGLAAAMSSTRSGLHRVVDVALDAFGPERLMYGSDWPLNELCGGPGAWRRAVDELIGELSRTEQQAIMGGTATAFYQRLA